MKINTNKAIYNGLSIRQILSKLPKNMVKTHKKLYIKNCLFVYENENNKVNLGYCRLTRNSNNLLIKTYIN